MLKRLSATVAGIIVAMLVIGAIEWIDHGVYPLPAELLETGDAVAIGAAVPLAAKLIVVAGWLLGSFAGGWLALRIADWAPSAWIVAAIVLAGIVYELFVLPFPLPVTVLALLAPPAGALLARSLHRRPYAGEPLLG